MLQTLSMHCYTLLHLIQVSVIQGELAVPKQHQSKAMKNVMAELERLGFNIERVKSGVYKILPPPSIEGPMYTTHGTESALHPMRRDFKRMYGIDLKV